jgi:hypothetical protein
MLKSNLVMLLLLPMGHFWVERRRSTALAVTFREWRKALDTSSMTSRPELASAILSKYVTMHGIALAAFMHVPVVTVPLTAVTLWLSAHPQHGGTWATWVIGIGAFVACYFALLCIIIAAKTYPLYLADRRGSRLSQEILEKRLRSRWTGALNIDLVIAMIVNIAVTTIWLPLML